MIEQNLVKVAVKHLSMLSSSQHAGCHLPCTEHTLDMIVGPQPVLYGARPPGTSQKSSQDLSGIQSSRVCILVVRW